MTTRKQDGLFVTLNVSVQFIRGAIQGCILSLIAAYIVLLVSTRSTGNVVIAALAILCFIGVVASAFGLMQLLSWEISIIEAICASLLVWFLVDYIALEYTFDLSLPLDDSESESESDDDDDGLIE